MKQDEHMSEGLETAASDATTGLPSTNQIVYPIRAVERARG